MLATLTKTPVGRAAAQRFPRKQQNLREAAPQLHPPKTGRQQTLLSLLSFHWFILSPSVISDFGSASSRALPSSPCPSLLQHWAGLQRTSCLILSFFLFVEGYKCKECFCFFFFPFFASSSWTQSPSFPLHTQLLPPQLHELSPTTVLSFSSRQEEHSSVVSSV